MSGPLQRIVQTARHMTTSATAAAAAAAAAATAGGSGSSRTAEAALTELSTCEVADALVKLKVPGGGHLPGIDRYSPVGPAQDGPTVCGRAYTVRMVAGTQASAPKPPTHFADAVPHGSVIVIQTPPNARSAAWGGLMTLRAVALGAKGVVIDGRCRDLDEHRQAGFNVFARGHSILGQSPFTRPSELNVPLTIADPTLKPSSAVSDAGEEVDPLFPATTVHPGDYILADVDGVVVVPPALVEQVLELAQKGKAVDARVAADLKQGVSVTEAFKRHRGK